MTAIVDSRKQLFNKSIKMAAAARTLRIGTIAWFRDLIGQ
jgi:hypothetical protein